MNESLTFIHDFVHFMKWSAKYISICPFHEMDNWVVHFMKWTISLSISRNGQFHTWVVTCTLGLCGYFRNHKVILNLKLQILNYSTGKDYILKLYLIQFEAPQNWYFQITGQNM